MVQKPKKKKKQKKVIHGENTEEWRKSMRVDQETQILA